MRSSLRDKSILKGLFFVTLVATAFSLISCAQTREFQNERYEKIDGEWYKVADSDQKFRIIENTLTVKYLEDATESGIKDQETRLDLTLLRKSAAGWYDYEIPEGTDVFKKAEDLMKSGIVAKVEIPTGGVYTGSE